MVPTVGPLAGWAPKCAVLVTRVESTSDANFGGELDTWAIKEGCSDGGGRRQTVPSRKFNMHDVTLFGSRQVVHSESESHERDALVTWK